MKRLSVKKLMAGLSVLAVTSCIPAQAASSDGVQINMSGTLIEPLSCQINGNSDLTIDFGSEIIPRKIIGENYAKDLQLNISCEGNYTNALRIQFYGSPPDFDKKVVALTKKGIGVAIYNGGAQIGVSEWYNFLYEKKLPLKLVLVRNPDQEITGGEFSGYVTMRMDYR